MIADRQQDDTSHPDTLNRESERRLPVRAGALSVLLVPLAEALGWTADGALASGSGLVAAGGFHTCVVKGDGTPLCWGADGDGQATVPPGIGTVSWVGPDRSRTHSRASRKPAGAGSATSGCGST